MNLRLVPMTNKIFKNKQKGQATNNGRGAGFYSNAEPIMESIYYLSEPDLTLKQWEILCTTELHTSLKKAKASTDRLAGRHRFQLNVRTVP